MSKLHDLNNGNNYNRKRREERNTGLEQRMSLILQSMSLKIQEHYQIKSRKCKPEAKAGQ